MPDQLMAHRALLAEATETLVSNGLVGADTDARRILECVLGVPGPELGMHLDTPATTRTVNRLRAMVARRGRGEPLQYVLGEWSFRTLDLMVDRRVLIPRPETEVVVGQALDLLSLRAAPEPLVLDLGTGSGAIALSVAVECPEAQIIATDRSSEALQVARANLTGIGRAATRVQLREGSWFDALPPDLRGRVDLIVSNPPYIAATEELPAEVARWEPAPALIAGPEGTEALDHLLDAGFEWLAASGSIVLELAPHQAADVGRRASSAGYCDVTLVRDLAGRQRVLSASRPAHEVGWL